MGNRSRLSTVERASLVDGGAMNTEWMAEGNCAHESPALFFPSDGVGVEVARRICADCPVKAVCLEYALANRIDHGVWGGSSERERRRILKRRRQAAGQPTTVIDLTVVG
jgi:WhiB family redox-sensing transcriptional regulator